jgi:iron(III) transport system ATP-binding protein
MRAGRVIQEATPVDLYSNPADLHVARFVGDAVELEADSENGIARTALGAISVRDGMSGRGVVLVRPEQLTLGDSGVSGSVLDIVFHGHDALLRVGLPTLEVVLRVVTPVSVRVGDDVRVSVRGQAQFYPLP